MKKHIKIIIPAVLLGLISVVYFANVEFYKVTDPNNPKFEKSKFKVTDYKGNDFDSAIKLILPKGSHIELVDEILVGSANMKKRQLENRHNTYRYDYEHATNIMPGGGLSFLVIRFDDEDRLEEFIAINN